MDIELKKEKRKEHDYPDPNDRIGKIAYSGCLFGIILIFAFIFLFPFITLFYEWEIDGAELKNVELPATQPQQQLDLAQGFLMEVFDYPAGKKGSVVVLKDRKRNIIWSVDCEQIQGNCKSIRLDRWLPFDSISIKGRMILDEGYEKDILFSVGSGGKLKKIYGES